MLKLAMTASAAVALLLCTGVSSDPAKADGWRHHHRHHHHHHWRHHRWGDNDWEIIRWSYGDCKIWHDDNGPPWGTWGVDYVVLAEGLPTWDAAWARLLWLKGRGKCA